jgi:hypothetical protein
MNSSSNFLKKENIALLWEVISEDDIMREKNELFQSQVYTLFTNNLEGFHDSYRGQSMTLINMNKTYIRLIINYIHNNHSLEKEREKEKEKENKDKSKFEMDLTRKQNEFTSAMTKPVPPVPKFSDKIDEPMSEMALAIKLAQEQRNYDTEQVKKSFNSSNNTEWLKSQETSVQNEKMTKVTKKYIKIHNKEENVDNGVIDLESREKHISWQEQDSLTEIIPDLPFQDNMLEGLFSKLKKVNPTPTPDDAVMSLTDKVDALTSKVNLILQILSEKEII